MAGRAGVHELVFASSSFSGIGPSGPAVIVSRQIPPFGPTMNCCNSFKKILLHRKCWIYGHRLGCRIIGAVKWQVLMARVLTAITTLSWSSHENVELDSKCNIFNGIFTLCIT